MPQYSYKHPKKNKYVEIIQTMNEPHTYVDDEGIIWERVWTVPQGCVKENFSLTDSRDFAHRTKHSKGSVGDLIDRSQELSDKRAKESSSGRDSIKDKTFDDWSKKRGGKQHPDDDRLKK